MDVFSSVVVGLVAVILLFAIVLGLRRGSTPYPEDFDEASEHEVEQIYDRALMSHLDLLHDVLEDGDLTVDEALSMIRGLEEIDPEELAESLWYIPDEHYILYSNEMQDYISGEFEYDTELEERRNGRH